MEKTLNNVFSSDKRNEFIDFHKIMKERKAKYRFLIPNSDSSDKEETHWQRNLDIHPKNRGILLCLIWHR